MNIGTAKPTDEELSLAEHHFINNLSIHDNYNVGMYEEEAINLLNSIYSNVDVAILVGGTGLYINAVLQGLDSFPKIDSSIRQELNSIFKKEGINTLQLMLKEKDPEYAKEVDLGNPHRLIRALSVILSSGEKFSSYRNKLKKDRNFVPIKIALTMERHKLYERINNRVENMMEAGLLEEVRSLEKHKHLNALNTVGYSELFDHLAGKGFESEAVDQIKQNTRRYAKRQSTWFRNQGEWNYFDSHKSEEIIQFVLSKLEN